MASAAVIEKPETGTSIVAQVEANPVMVLTDREKFNRFYEEIKRKTDAHVPDLTTEKGRKAIASLAYDVARTKTAIDDAGKKLNEDARARINAVDEARREIRQQLDALKEEVRRPLTEWEAAEEARLEECRGVLDVLRHAATVGYDETAADVRARLAEIEAMAFDPAAFEGYLPQATALQSVAIAALAAAADRLEREEADRAELERLRAADAERAAKEAEEQARRAQGEAEREATAEAERRRVAAEEAEATRIREAAERAAQAAREEQERLANEAAAERERAHEAALAQERHQREEIERIANEERAERERADAQRRADEAAATAAAEQEAEEARARAADRAHRTAVMTTAKEALMTCGADEETARKIVLAIIGGEIPAVTLAF